MWRCREADDGDLNVEEKMKRGWHVGGLSMENSGGCIKG